MQRKTTVRYGHTPVRMAKTKNSDGSEDAEKSWMHYIATGNINSATVLGKVWQFLNLKTNKTKQALAI